MARLAVSRDIHAPATEVWALIAEFRYWPQWGPTVREVTSDASEVAVGVTGKVLTPLGFKVPFTITDVEPGHSWEWKIAGRRATGHAVTPLDHGRSRATFTVSWLLAPYAAVLYWGLRRIAAIAETKDGEQPG